MPEIEIKVHAAFESIMKTIADATQIGVFSRGVRTELGWPDVSPDGVILSYRLFHKQTQRYLADNETLASAKVHSGDDLFLERTVLAGGSKTHKQFSNGHLDASARESFVQVQSGQYYESSVGVNLEIDGVGINEIFNNMTALKMLLHDYREALIKLGNYEQEATDSQETIERLKYEIQEKDRKLLEKGAATFLFLGGQVVIGFATNFITNSLTGGWPLFCLGLAVNFVGLWLALIGVTTSAKGRKRRKPRRFTTEVGK